MRRAIHTAVRLAADVFAPPGPIVEVGSLYLAGYDDLCNLRPHFKGRRYVGCDIRFGFGVDHLHDAEQLGFRNQCVGTVLLLETLEHLRRPAHAIAEARRVLCPGGLLLVSVPFNYRLHGFPSDYWRFTASGVHTLLGDFADSLVVAVGPRLKPAFIFAVATKRDFPSFDARSVEFQRRLEAEFQRPGARLRGHISVLKERGRDFFGYLLGRADLSVSVYDASAPCGYAARDVTARGRSQRSS